MTHDETEKARKIVIKKIEEYNRLLTKFQSNESKIVITMISVGFWASFGLSLHSDYIIIIIASLFSTSMAFFISAISGKGGYTAIDIYLNPQWAAFYASLQDNKPILLLPLLDKSDLWQKMASKQTNGESAVEDLVIGTISKLKTYSIVHYERERLHNSVKCD